MKTAAIMFNLILGIYTIITWIVNLIKFVNCDFESPWKYEIVHGLGVVIPPISWATAWI